MQIVLSWDDSKHFTLSVFNWNLPPLGEGYSPRATENDTCTVPELSNFFQLFFILITSQTPGFLGHLSTVHNLNLVLLLCQRRWWHPTPVLLPGKSHGRRSLVGCSPWGRESDTTERLHFHFSLSCIGEGNGSPLQCSCLENPRDGGAWWAAVCGVAQSLTRLKWLSSSSSSPCCVSIPDM